MQNTVTPNSKINCQPQKNQFHGSKLKSKWVIGGNPREHFVKTLLCFGQNVRFTFHRARKIKVKPVCTGGLEKENAMNTQFYKPQTPQGVCCVPHSGVVFGLFSWPVKTSIFQGKYVKRRDFKGTAGLLWRKLHIGLLPQFKVRTTWVILFMMIIVDLKEMEQSCGHTHVGLLSSRNEENKV